MTNKQAAILGVLAGAATIVGAIGAWATYQGHHFAGTDANRGKTVAIAAGVALLLLLLTAAAGFRWSSALAIIAGGVALGLTVWSLSNIAAFAGASGTPGIGRGWGVWLATIASIVLVLAALAATFMHRATAMRTTTTTTTAAPPPPAPPAAPPAPPADTPPTTPPAP